MYIFFICYSYQFLYIVISFFRKKAVHQPEVFHRLAILIAARMAIGSSSAVSGTGFLFSDEVINAYNGWNFFTLTEDIEFTITNVSRGVTIGYAADAILYDEQPTSFRQSWNQRLRWAKGYLQVLRKYGSSLFKGIFHGSFSCYDMLMNILPAAALTAVSILVNLGAVVYSFLGNGSFAALGTSLLQLFISLCLTVFILGLITTITEWKQIHCPTWKKNLTLDQIMANE